MRAKSTSLEESGRDARDAAAANARPDPDAGILADLRKKTGASRRRSARAL